MGKQIMENIVNTISDLNTNLRLLLDAALLKQHALINLNYNELENAILDEEKILNTINECEQMRIRDLEKFYSSQDLTHSTYRISELCEKYGTPENNSEVKRLLLLEKQIKETICEVDKINHQNKYIIEHSRSFIKETISSLMSSNKTIVDKKV